MAQIQEERGQKKENSLAGLEEVNSHVVKRARWQGPRSSPANRASPANSYQENWDLLLFSCKELNCANSPSCSEVDLMRTQEQTT